MLGYGDGQNCVEFVEKIPASERESSLEDRKAEGANIGSDEVGIVNDSVLRQILNQGYQRESDGSVKLKAPGNLFIRIAPTKLGTRQETSNMSNQESSQVIVSIFHVKDMKSSLHFWRDLLGLRVQRGTLFGDPSEIFIFANDEDVYPSIVLRKSRSKEVASNRADRYQFTFNCPAPQIQLLALLAAREGQLILQPFSTSSLDQSRFEPCLILLSPDGNRVRFTPSENIQLAKVPAPLVDIPSPQTRDAVTGKRESQSIGTVLPAFSSIIKSHTSTLTRLLARISAEEAAESTSPLSMDHCRDIVTQTCSVLESLSARLTNARNRRRDDFSDSLSSEQQWIQSCADCVPDVDRLRNESKFLLAFIGDARRELQQIGRTRSDLQDSISRAKDKVKRFRAELQAADENVLKCVSMTTDAQDEWSQATEAMQV